MNLIKKSSLYILLPINCFAVTEFFDVQKDFINNNFRLGLYYNYSETQCVFQQVDVNEILVDLNNKQYQYFSESLNIYSGKIFSNLLICSITLKPFEKIYYNIKLGLITAQSLSWENTIKRLNATDFGHTGSLHINYTIFPETIVNPSLMCGIGVTGLKYKFDHLTENGIFKINTELNVLDNYLSFSTDKNISKSIESYLGIKIISRNSSLTDKVNYYKISGNNYLISLNFGGRIFFTKTESINLELTWLPDKYGWSASLGIMLGY